jgi:hypothetical protein
MVLEASSELFDPLEGKVVIAVRVELPACFLRFPPGGRVPVGSPAPAANPLSFSQPFSSRRSFARVRSRRHREANGGHHRGVKSKGTDDNAEYQDGGLRAPGRPNHPIGAVSEFREYDAFQGGGLRALPPVTGR